MSGQVSRAHLVLLAREQRLAPLFSSSPFSSSAPSGHSPVPAASIKSSPSRAAAGQGWRVAPPSGLSLPAASTMAQASGIGRGGSSVYPAGLAARSMARAIVASTYIRQLRSGLPRCCLHGRSRRWDGTSTDERQDWYKPICEMEEQPRIRPARHTRVGCRNSARSLGPSSCQDRSLWNQAEPKIAPKRNGELARDRNDHDALIARTLTLGALHKPLGDGALGLMF